MTEGMRHIKNQAAQRGRQCIPPDEPMTICACCRDKEDGVWRFVCRCGFQAETASNATGCPRCGIPLRFPVDIKAE